MRMTVYGAGAVGGGLAARLALAGHDVSVVARGPHGRAMRESGLTLLAGERRDTVRVTCVENPADLPPQDLVFVTVKSHQLTGDRAAAGAAGQAGRTAGVRDERHSVVVRRGPAGHDAGLDDGTTRSRRRTRAAHRARPGGDGRRALGQRGDRAGGRAQHDVRSQSADPRYAPSGLAGGRRRDRQARRQPRTTLRTRRTTCARISGRRWCSSSAYRRRRY